MSFKSLTTALILFTTITWNLIAQDTPPADRLAVTLTHGYTGTAGFDDAVGEFDVNTTSFKAKSDMFTVKYDHHYFDWKRSDSLPLGSGGDPWTDLHFIETSVTLNKSFSKDWMVQYKFGIGAGFEKESNDSLSLCGSIGFMRQWDDVSLIVGIMGAGYQKLDPIILPMLGIGWRQGQPGWSAALGIPATEVRYGFNKEFSLAAGLLVDVGNPAKLSDDSTVASGGYARLEGGGLELSTKWTPTDKFELRLGIASVGARKLTVYDRDGDELNDYDLEDTWCGRLSLTMRF